MVDIYFISKSIDEAMQKSHQHLRLPNNVKNTFNDFAEDTRNRKKEKAIITNDDGKILKKKNGGNNSVDVSAEVFLAYWDGNHKKPVHIEHNHPNKHHDFFPTRLSTDDMHRLFDKCTQVSDYYGEYMVKSITCEDSFNHSRMTIVRGDNFKNVDHKTNPEKYQEVFEKGGKFWQAEKKLSELYTGDFRQKYNAKNQEIFTKLWNDIKDKPSTDSKEYKQLQEEVSMKASDKALHEIGFYKELGNVQKLFREADFKLTLEWVDN